MASFVALTKFTEQGIKNVNQTTKRAEAFREAAKKMGVTVKEIYWTLGRYDVVSVFDAPDDETALRLMLSLGSLGNVRTETLRAFSVQEMGQVLKGMK
ncbi:MAG: GYD domain-containing protein [candidate division NC10 bacterium]|nr:GYD domain-containing protein [candidate division NC10 bacterium]